MNPETPFPREVDRRGFLKSAAAAAGLGALDLPRLAAGEEPAPAADWIDVNVNLSRWPLRRVAGDETADLAARLRAAGITRAWAGSFDGLLHKDLAAVNARLAEECRRHGEGLFVPFGSVNPALPDWEEDLRRCAGEHRMPGVRLHPGYHGYRLDDPAFARLLRFAAEKGLVVELALLMEDERMMHPLLRAPAVDPAPLPALLKEVPRLRLVLLNALGKLRGESLSRLLAAGEVYVEISMLEGAAGLENLLREVPPGRVLFGSHSPLFYFESAALKLKESALSEADLAAIRSGNARGIVP